jgi:hypothetical protein
MPDAEELAQARPEQPSPRGLTARETSALGALAVFVFAMVVGGFLIAPAVGCFTTAAAALIVALLVGWR